jgi:hypothetical protein
MNIKYQKKEKREKKTRFESAETYCQQSQKQQ